MALRDILRPLALLALAALLFLASKTAMIVRFDEMLAPIFFLLWMFFTAMAFVYLGTKIQFSGISVTGLIRKAAEIPLGAAIVVAALIAFMTVAMTLVISILDPGRC